MVMLKLIIVLLAFIVIFRDFIIYNNSKFSQQQAINTSNINVNKTEASYLINNVKIPLDVYEVYEIDGLYINNDFIENRNRKFKHFYSNITYNLKDITDTRIIIIKRKNII